MPYPAQIDRQAILDTARRLIEEHGADWLSLTHVATALGVKTPSLYRHIESRAALIQAINRQTSQDLFAGYYQALHNAGPYAADQLEAICQAHRRFAKHHRQTYLLLFADHAPAERANPAELEQAVIPLQQVMAQISGSDESLTALRGLLSLIHGFVVLELNQQFQRGGDLDQTYRTVVRRYLRSWAIVIPAESSASNAPDQGSSLLLQE